MDNSEHENNLFTSNDNLSTTNTTVLSNYWTLWFHKIDTHEWSKNSYTNISKFNTLEEFTDIYKQIDNFIYGFFFLMKDDIFPLFENDENKNGGYWSLKIPNDKIKELWIRLSAILIGNTLVNDINNKDIITGITISPKPGNCILKILNNDSKYNNVSILNNKDLPELKDAIYTVHKNRTY
jgi:translation initiation factor 4E